MEKGESSGLPAGGEDYSQATQKLVAFLTSFEEDGLDDVERKYVTKLQEVANRLTRIVEVYLDDVEANLGDEMAERIERNAHRYKQLFADAIDSVMPEPTVDIVDEDVADVLMSSRRDAPAEDGLDAGGEAGEPRQTVPAALKRRYEVRLIPRTGDSKSKALPIRKVKADTIGHLVTVKGIVTRVSEVKPQLALATYTCDQGGYEVYQEVNGRSFMPLFTCPVPACCNKNGRLALQTRGSKFIKFQEVKIQEEASEVPTGHVPRSMTIHLYGELTRSCSAGDTVTVSGIFLPVPYAGWKALKAGLVTDTYLEASFVSQHKKSHVDFLPDSEMAERIAEMTDEDDMYSKLARSIAPEIFGHEDVKKALLLLLVGGVTRAMPDGMKIRGDINVCLMGDPGVAKSQLLKHISTVAPRAVYTTGKGSSGVGLTAAVIRDGATGELVLEGGALVLADKGICCIDEFDKMEEADRTAIHEVMEQQTVSIAKAGITTTLNARTSVLAAANPLYSRYNPTKTPEENINLPAALLSRFDLLWLILDRSTWETDKRLAEHVVYVHRNESHPPAVDAVEPALLRAFVSHVRQFEPSVTPEVSEYIVDEYVAMRQEANENEVTVGFTSARTLLAILRLSQALARLRCAHEVVREDIVEARRLMTLSKSSIYDAADGDADGAKNKVDPVSVVYQIIREHARANRLPAVNVSEILPKVLSRGRTKEDLERCMAEYEELDVWQVNADRTIIRFVDDGDNY
jgi:DNA replication licensing factor MCM7